MLPQLVQLAKCHPPHTIGSHNRQTPKNTIVLKKDKIEDIFPLENALNKADANILIPVNRKLKEKIAKPYFVRSKTSLPDDVNTMISGSKKRFTMTNVRIETTKTKYTLILNSFFSCSLS